MSEFPNVRRASGHLEVSKMYAIQTKFNAHRYRSRLEARYAVLLQVCGLPFQYERGGFELESGRIFQISGFQQKAYG